MTRRTAPVVAMLAVALAGVAATAVVPKDGRDPDDLVVHEWGTFTSIAGEDGQPLEWLPLGGQSDLPCFVSRFRDLPGKPGLIGTVRMETPVLYFYTPHETEIDVTVRFHQGLVTEWFPQALVRPTVLPASGLRARGFSSAVSWRSVVVLPAGSDAFPAEEGTSHYYAARDTDAAPLQVEGERERFLFYRGVGRFPLPISATIDDAGDVVVNQHGSSGIEDVILFENRNGAVRYRFGQTAAGSSTIVLPSASGELPALFSQVERRLVARGLYPREAAAMIETWRDSWFEEGTRLLYTVPPQTIDAVLPLDVQPRPTAVARVFIGRIELVTPKVKQAVRRALEANDTGALSAHGRFLQPIADRVLRDLPETERDMLLLRLATVYASASARTATGCHP